MLTKLELNNFKSWEKLDLKLAPITLLFGTNSSGKTSILQSLLTLKQTAASFDRAQPIYFGGAERDYVDLGTYRDLVFQHNDKDKRVQIELDWSTQTPATFFLDEKGSDVQSFTYNVRWRKLTERVVIERLSYRTSNHDLFFQMERGDEDQYSYTTAPGMKTTRGRNPSISAPESCYAIPREISRQYSDFDPLEFNRQFEILMSRIVYLGPLRRYPRRVYPYANVAPKEIGLAGENALDALIASERKRPGGRKKNPAPILIDQVAESLQSMQIVSTFKVNSIDEDERYYKTVIQVSPGSAESSLVDVGFGVSQVLPVIALLFFAPEHSIVLIEQPELHLHPVAQANLADLMLQVAERRHLQLIVESHSEHLLRRVQRRIAEPTPEFATPDNVHTYFCRAGANGSVCERVELTRYGQIANYPKDFFGDIAGDLDAMYEAGIAAREQELMVGD
jgi:predicted ATPase